MAPSNVAEARHPHKGTKWKAWNKAKQLDGGKLTDSAGCGIFSVCCFQGPAALLGARGQRRLPAAHMKAQQVEAFQNTPLLGPLNSREARRWTGKGPAQATVNIKSNPYRCAAERLHVGVRAYEGKKQRCWSDGTGCDRDEHSCSNALASGLGLLGGGVMALFAPYRLLLVNQTELN